MTMTLGELARVNGRRATRKATELTFVELGPRLVVQVADWREMDKLETEKSDDKASQ